MAVYLDNNATTRVDPRVQSVMHACEIDCFGNPASRDHGFGWDAEAAVESARATVAELIGANPTEIFFTGSATESCNMAIRGWVPTSPMAGILAPATEHDAVLGPMNLLKDHARPATILKADALGEIDWRQLDLELATGEFGLVCLSMANHEIGNISALSDAARAVHGAGALLFADLTQAVGKIPIEVHPLGVDLAAFSAHKIYGPKGVAALFVRGGVNAIQLVPLIVGGGQERKLRAGTLNVPGIVGFAEACRLASSEMARESERLRAMRDRFETALTEQLSDIWINGNLQRRLANTTNIGFRHIQAKLLIREMNDIACSTKSACASSDIAPSRVLKAIGLSDDDAYSCIRFSLGRFTTDDEIDYAISKVVAAVRNIRKR